MLFIYQKRKVIQSRAAQWRLHGQRFDLFKVSKSYAKNAIRMVNYAYASPA